MFIFPAMYLVHSHLLTTKRFQSTKLNSFWYESTVQSFKVRGDFTAILNHFQKSFPRLVHIVILSRYEELFQVLHGNVQSQVFLS